MSRIAVLTVACLASAAACYFLPATLRLGCMIAIASGYAIVVIVGVISWGSPLFGDALTKLPHGQGQVALTFDDGPDPDTTPALLDLLAQHEAKVSFFVIGEQVRRHPEIVARCHSEGHTVGNHSNTHGLWTNLLFHGAMRREIDACQAAITTATGVCPDYYRPPFGLRNHAVSSVCRGLGLQVTGWSVRGLDKPLRSIDAIVERVLGGVEDGSIILLHDGDIAVDDLLTVVDRILQALTRRGLRSVALPAAVASSA